MVALAPLPHPFALLPLDHAFTAAIERFRTRIATYMPRGGAHALYAELKARPESEATWRLEHFFWSRQSWDAPGRLPFRADTLAYRDGAADAAWYTFPQDPSLEGMSEAIAKMLTDWPAARIDVLRYVPLRRLTFRVVEGRRSVFVGKIKPRSRVHDAAARLGAVARAAAAAQTSFRVAWPTGVDDALCLTMQEALPGTRLLDQFTHFTARALTYRLGAVLSELHALQGVQLPGDERAVPRNRLANDLHWIAFMRPELATMLTHLGEQLGRTVPAPAARQCLCHGNFVPSQILADGGAWAVLNFDHCYLGDPYQDLAILLAALPYNVPVLRLAPPDLLQRAEAACISGYTDHAGAPLETGKLLWHRVCSEIAFLGLALAKDWLDQPSFERVVARLEAFARELAETD